MQYSTLYDKIWHDHIVDETDDGVSVIYIDCHLIHEVTSPQAFEGLRAAGRALYRPKATIATADHNVPTVKIAGLSRSQALALADIESQQQVGALVQNVKDFGIEYFGIDDIRQGIVHIIGPEQGFTQPGMTIVCGDSHTSTHGAFGALSFGIGTSEVEHVLATQTLLLKRSKNMRITVDGVLGTGVGAKDIALAIIAHIGTAGGTGHVIEFAGNAIRQLSMEGRMTLCNMAIEAGARSGLIAPDQKTFDYLRGRPKAPAPEYFDQAVEYWAGYKTDCGAVFDKEYFINASDIAPQVTWGTSPQDALPITAKVPDPDDCEGADVKASMIRALDYMGLKAGMALSDIRIDHVFIGSCTNGRIEDLRDAANIIKGRKVASHVNAMVVPGSGLVKAQAEAEGLADIFIAAGFSWREPGCSMCLAMNADKLKAGERCASTSNRNFEGRQGRGGRTHLLSPAMAAAAAIAGHLTDVRDL